MFVGTPSGSHPGMLLVCTSVDAFKPMRSVVAKEGTPAAELDTGGSLRKICLISYQRRRADEGRLFARQQQLRFDLKGGVWDHKPAGANAPHGSRSRYALGS